VASFWDVSSNLPEKGINNIVWESLIFANLRPEALESMNALAVVKQTKKGREM
jgi:hypothetical protein